MAWIYALVVSWIVFFILVRRGQKVEICIGALIAITLQLMMDINAHILGLYYIHGALLNVYGSPICFTLGPVLTMGIIFVQHLPKHRWWQAAHIAVFSTLFFLFELLVQRIGNLEYIHWNHLGSFFVDVTVFMALSWAGAMFASKKGVNGA